MQQFSKEDNRPLHPVDETPSFFEEEKDVDDVDLVQELIQCLRQSFQGPRAWVFLLTLAGAVFAFLVQTGLIWPLLFFLVVGGLVFFHIAQQHTILLPESEQSLTEPQKQKEGLLAQIKTLDDIQLLTGRQFELLVADLMKHQGYSDVQVVGRSRDLCVDIKAIGCKGEQVAVQCKRYTATKKIVSRDMQAFYGMVQHHGVQRGMYVTTSSYTKDARELAEIHSIELIDGVGLTKIIDNLSVMQ